MRPIIEALGTDTREVLSPTTEKHSGAVDVSTLFDNDSNCDHNGCISRVLERAYHADGGADGNDPDDRDSCINIGHEYLNEKEIVLKQKLNDTRENGIYDTGAEVLENVIREFDDVTKLKLEGGEPGDIEPLRVCLKSDAMPIRAKQRCYPAPKRVFMTHYVRQLMKLGFVKKATSPEWVSAPLTGPKRRRLI